MSSTTDVLSTLFDTQSIKLEKFKKEVKVKKVTLRTMKPILTLLSRIIADLKLTAENIPGVNLQDPGLILKLISTYYDEVVAIVVSLTNVTPDELLDMETDESVVIIQAVVALNKDFFTTKVLPNLRHLGEVADA